MESGQDFPESVNNLLNLYPSLITVSTPLVNVDLGIQQLLPHPRKVTYHLLYVQG